MTPDGGFEYFVQVGATRDGREPYLDAARRRGLRALLVDTPEYLAYRSLLGRREFDALIAVAAPADLAALHGAIAETGYAVRIVLPGFERYAESAHALAAQLGLLRGLGRIRPFVPPDKLRQRDALRHNAPHVAQPEYVPASRAQEGVLPFPLVVKPVDGGGGLGVVRVDNAEQLAEALRHVRTLRNYDGARFRRLLLECYVEGEESSLQGLVRSGTCEVLAYCRKVIGSEPIPGGSGSSGFRELAHLAVGGGETPRELLAFARACAEAVGYEDGPFHIDLRETACGPVFIEMGFRLSGGAVCDLVRDVSGVDWGDAAFGWTVGERTVPAPLPHSRCAANVLVHHERQIECALAVRFDGVTLAVERLEHPLPALSSTQRAALGADLSRHRGPIARVHVVANDLAALREATSQILAAGSHRVELRDHVQRQEVRVR